MFRKPDEMSTDILTLEEASAFLKLSKSTIYNMAQNRKLPAIKLGRSWRFVKSQLIKWLEEKAFYPDRGIPLRRDKGA